ncbi:hypothetical protein PYJP_18080 [Pyrofollis japonicus]|jgi:DNA-binding IclR family transcriptional regulator|uniref:hypothetical protein n=1 Tax=Pyrofollis japonicus TaxID=3060460 RepID=UPI00295C28A1|nr:hypothetical protein [Pyrofollis japonicus]BEP18456.1 hypothetical protein PYJP_18080 [Pyrofollis japonicus]
MPSILKFLREVSRNGGKFTLYDFIEKTKVDDAYTILKQLERWGYIERIGDKEYRIVNEALKNIA